MNIYFSGIGGVGIGPLAEIAHDAGYAVYGSDQQASLMTKQLGEKGIDVHIGQDDTFLQEVHASSPIDWFIHTAALPPNHPELSLAKVLGIKTAKRDELIAHIIQDKNLKLVAIAGTHGKTTTTGMLIWSLMQLGVPISYSVGTTVSFGPSGKFTAGSKYFIYECDEFDRNFLHFSPYVSIIASIGYDHPDTYPLEENYKEAFRQFIEQSKHTILWEHDLRYTEADNSPHVNALQVSDALPLQLPGAHYRRNATLVAKALEHLASADTTTSKQILEAFPGTDRRFEKLAPNLYSDYGHHPTEISATLQMARELSENIVLVYQPHQNVRQHEIINQYTKSTFKDAETVYWLPTYLSREDPDLAVLSPDELSQNVPNAQPAKMGTSLWQKIERARREGKLVVAMGAGSIDAWLREQLS